MAHQADSFDASSDGDILELAEAKCAVLDRYGSDGFDDFAQNPVAIIDRERVADNIELIGAAVRAYCPKHINALEEWADEALDSLETKIVPCGWTQTGMCWRDAQ